MTDFEREMIAGLARVGGRIGGVENAVAALTSRFETSEERRVEASAAHAERFARIEAAVAGTATNGEARVWRRMVEKWGPLVLAGLLGGAASGGAVRVSFGSPTPPAPPAAHP